MGLKKIIMRSPVYVAFVSHKIKSFLYQKLSAPGEVSDRIGLLSNRTDTDISVKITEPIPNLPILTDSYRFLPILTDTYRYRTDTEPIRIGKNR